MLLAWRQLQSFAVRLDDFWFLGTHLGSFNGGLASLA
jgi:hypothetical protein